MLRAIKDSPSLQHSFTFLLRRCAAITEQRGLDSIPEFAGHTNATESWVLALLVEGPSRPSQKDLARRIGISSVRMVKVVDSMEKHGLVRRERSEERRQTNYLELSPKGLKMYEAWKRNIIENPAIVSPLTLREREQLRLLLLKLSSGHTVTLA